MAFSRIDTKLLARPDTPQVISTGLSKALSTARRRYGTLPLAIRVAS